MNPVYSILIPVYNSTESLKELVQRINSVFKKEIQESFEIVFVNDGSPNSESWKTLKKLTSEHSNIVAINLLKNSGKGAAVLCGFHNIRGRYVVLMDDDLQHRPEDIPALIEKKEHDIVIGAFSQKKHSLFKRLTSSLKGKFDEWILQKPKGVKSSPFQLIKREIVEALRPIQVSQPFILGLLLSTSKDVVNVPVNHGHRKYGKSQFTLPKLFKQFNNLLFNYSTIPLKFVSFLGILCFVLSCVLSGFILYKKFFIGVEVSGWTSIVVIQLMTSGLILLALGVMGEYFSRLIRVSERRPPYGIREIIPHTDES